MKGMQTRTKPRVLMADDHSILLAGVRRLIEEFGAIGVAEVMNYPAVINGDPMFRDIIATAGWKTGMVISLLRGSECIDRHQHVHTHYASYPQGLAAVAYAEANGWLPVLHTKLFNPTSDHYGASPLEAAAFAIDVHNASGAWNKGLLDNAARPSGALQCVLCFVLTFKSHKIKILITVV